MILKIFNFQFLILDELVKSPKRHLYVIPMKMGIQCFQIVAHPLDSRVRGNDYFLRDCQFLIYREVAYECKTKKYFSH